MATKLLNKRSGKLEERLKTLKNRIVQRVEKGQSPTLTKYHVAPSDNMGTDPREMNRHIANGERPLSVARGNDSNISDKEKEMNAPNRDVVVGVLDSDLVGSVQEGDNVEDDLEEWEKDSMIQKLNGKLRVLKDHYGENYSNDKEGNVLKPKKKEKIMKIVYRIENELNKYQGGKSKSNKRKSRKNKKKSNKRKSKARKSRKQRK